MLKQSYLDKKIAEASAIRIRYPIAPRPGAAAECITLDLTPELRARLQEALALDAGEMPISCHCPGTAVLELLRRGTLESSLILHLHRQMHSVWRPGKDTGVKLQEGNVILHLLAEWGVRGPLEAVQDSSEEQTWRGPNMKQIKELLRQSEALAEDPARPGPTTPKK